MICLIILQVFSSQIDSAITSFENTDYDKAYSIALSIPADSAYGFEKDEILELQAYTSMRVGKFNQADSLFNVVLKTPYPNIRAKAYFDYAELQYIQFRFDRRLEYLLKAYELNPKQQYIRIIAEHYFEIEGDLKQAQKWIDKHPVPETEKDVTGLFLLRAKLAESQREYEQAMRYYVMARTEANRAGMFDYELFAAKGEHRMNNRIVMNNDIRSDYLVLWLLVGFLLIVVIRSLSTARYISR